MKPGGWSYHLVAGTVFEFTVGSVFCEYGHIYGHRQIAPAKALKGQGLTGGACLGQP